MTALKLRWDSDILRYEILCDVSKFVQDHTETLPSNRAQSPP